MSADSHNYAVSIEHIVRNVFHCDRLGFGGIVDADAIDCKAGMYTAMACSLATIYDRASAERKMQIDNFLDGYSYYSDKDIEDILKESGKGEMEKIIKDFRKLLK